MMTTTMTNQQRAAMQMALEALEGIYIPDGLDFIADWWPKCREAITALRSALAQPQGEPFGYLRQTDRATNPPHGWAFHFFSGDVPIYTTPPSVESMRIETLEKAAELREQLTLHGVQSSDYEDGFWDGLAAYEKAIKEMK